MSKNMPFVYFFYTFSFIMFMSSSQWFMLWVMLELNSIMFIPLLIKKRNNQEHTASMTYFLTQSAASLLLIFSLFNTEISNTSESYTPKVLMLLALMVKLSTAPVHSWLPAVAVSLTRTNIWLLLTLQKLMPLTLLMLSKPTINSFLVMCITMSVAMGATMNMNQNNTKLILAYSSISHAGWFLTASSLCQESWMFYFISYASLLFILKMSLNKTISQQSMKPQKNSILSLLTLLSLGGLPPLMGFFPKVMIISSTIQMEIMVLAVILVMFSAVDLFIYVRLSYQAMMNKKSKMMWLKKEKYMSIVAILLTNALFSVVVIL